MSCGFGGQAGEPQPEHDDREGGRSGRRAQEAEDRRPGVGASPDSEPSPDSGIGRRSRPALWSGLWAPPGGQMGSVSGPFSYHGSLAERSGSERGRSARTFGYQESGKGRGQVYVMSYVEPEDTPIMEGNLVSVLTEVGRYDQARERLAHVLAIHEAAQDRPSVLATKYQLGVLDINQGLAADDLAEEFRGR